MKIQPRSVPKFLRAPSAGCVLLHGDDMGRAREIAQTLLDRASGREVLTLDATAASQDPNRILDAISSPGLFAASAPPTAIRIRGTARDLAKTLRGVIDAAPADARIVIEAGAYLPASDALRKLFEGHDRAAAIACPEPDDAALRRLFETEAGNTGARLSDAAAERLLARVPRDTAAARSEIGKVLLLRPSGEIGVDDVDAVVGDGTATRLDEATDAAAGGHVGAADTAARRLMESGTSPVGLLRILRNHVARIARVRAEIDAGTPVKDALSRLKPPLYGPRRDAFLDQVFAWSMEDLERALEKIDDVEAACKTTGGPDEILARHLIWEIAVKGRGLHARRARGRSKAASDGAGSGRRSR